MTITLRGMGLVVTLVLIGVILLVAEALLPGMIAGVLGFGCLVGAVVVGYTRYGSVVGHCVLAGVSLGLVAGTLAWFRYFPDSRFGRLFISKRVIGDIGAERPELLGQEGTAHSLLRPSGMAVIGGQRVDVVTEGGLVEPGTPIKVVAIEGMRVVVRPLDPAHKSQEVINS